MNQIAIFASGSGSNAENLVRHFRTHPSVRVSLILCNRPGAGVLKRAADLGVPSRVFTREEFYQNSNVVDQLREEGIDFVVLAGFLWLVPARLIEAYPGRIINIHPALLPKYGGKGMYGSHVHEAVIAAREAESGISIHHVNQEYDDGDIIFQARCPVHADDSPETLAGRIHELEYTHFPRVVEELINEF